MPPKRQQKGVAENAFKTGAQKCCKSPPRAPQRGPKVVQKCSKITPKSTPGGHRALGVPPGGAQAPPQLQNHPKSDKIIAFSNGDSDVIGATYKQQPRRGQSPGSAQISIFSTPTVTSLATAYKRRPRRRQSPGSAHLSICSTATVTSLETVYKKRPRAGNPREAVDSSICSTAPVTSLEHAHKKRPRHRQSPACQKIHGSCILTGTARKGLT